MVFITFPGSRHSPTHVPWYDIVIMVCIGLIFSYFAYYAERIVLEAWEYAAPREGVGWHWQLGRLCWKPGVALADGRCLQSLRCSRCIRHLLILYRL